MPWNEIGLAKYVVPFDTALEPPPAPTIYNLVDVVGGVNV